MKDWACACIADSSNLCQSVHQQPDKGNQSREFRSMQNNDKPDLFSPNSSSFPMREEQWTHLVQDMETPVPLHTHTVCNQLYSETVIDKRAPLLCSQNVCRPPPVCSAVMFMSLSAVHLSRHCVCKLMLCHFRYHLVSLVLEQRCRILAQRTFREQLLPQQQHFRAILLHPDLIVTNVLNKGSNPEDWR